MKIGKQVREYFTEYFSDTNKIYNIENFLNKDWCNETFGICYPLLKEVDIAKSISDQKNYNNGYGRYWIKPVLNINGKQFLLCSQWFRNFHNKFNLWILNASKPKHIKEDTKCSYTSDLRHTKVSYNSSLGFDNIQLYGEVETIMHLDYVRNHEKDVRRDKTQCADYDIKKSVCMCVESPYFTMFCGGAAHCKFYTENEELEENDMRSNTLHESESEIEIKEKIYVVSADVMRTRKCTSCEARTERQMQAVLYYDGRRQVENKLGVYICQKCGRKHIHNMLFYTYTRKKSIENINVNFVTDNRC